MPFKSDLFSVLSALQSGVSGNVATIYVKAGDQGVDPAPDCSALHIPRNFVGVSGSILIVLNQFPWTGYPIFTDAGDYTGNFSSPILQFSLEPPYEN